MEYATVFIDMRRLITNTSEIMIKIKNVHTLINNKFV